MSARGQSLTPRLTGKLDEDVWGHAPWTSLFVDIEGDRQPKPRFDTRAKMLWDDEAFYVGVYMDEPHIWGVLTEHDSIIYHDNDFEVFLDPLGTGQHYGELEVNALNTTWDLLLTRPYRAGGKKIDGWEMHGFRTAIHIDGSLNDPSDIDTGWSVEIAIPWKALIDISDSEEPPVDGQQWRVGFSRVEWDVEIVNGAYQKVPDRPEYNWVWSQQGAIDMHRPERWGVVQFSSETTNLPPLRPLEGWEDRLTLIAVWEAQQAWFEKHGRYTDSIADLGLDAAGLTLEATAHQFEAHLGELMVDHELRLAR